MKLILFASMLGIPMAYVQIFEKYVFNDWGMAGTMAILVILDTITGMVWAWKQKGLSSSKLGRIPMKIIAYGASLEVVHLLSHSIVNGEPNVMMGLIMPYIDSVLYTGIMLREVMSINENLGKMGYAFLPNWLMVRIKDFNEKGKYVPGVEQPATPLQTPTPPAP